MASLLARSGVCSQARTLIGWRRRPTELDPTDASSSQGRPLPLPRRAVRGWLRADGPYPPDLAAVERVLAVARGEVLGTEVAPNDAGPQDGRASATEPILNGAVPILNDAAPILNQAGSVAS